MKYYDLPEGEYKKDQLTDDELWGAFSWLFHKSAANDTSYKFIFFNALLDCINRGKYKISFDVLFEFFCYYSWPLVVKYKIRQKAKASDGRLTELENKMNEFIDKYYDGQFIEWNKLYSNEKAELVSQIIKACKRYVVGAFFGDTKELFYSFSRKDEWIEINPEMSKFVKANLKLLHDLNYNKWAKFYSNKNDEELTKLLSNSIDKTFVRYGENVYRTILAIEYEMHREGNSDRVNTLELLWDSESFANSSEEEIDSIEAEEELYRDIESMTEYLKDPILLINKIKRDKSIII